MVHWDCPCPYTRRVLHTGRVDEPDDMTTAVTIPAPYYTVHTCTRCGAEVHGLHGRWTCSSCGECSPYVEPPQGWQSEIGYKDIPDLPPRPKRPRA